jgi:tetratricopeptide (TPR) repeat protein
MFKPFALAVVVLALCASGAVHAAAANPDIDAHAEIAAAVDAHAEVAAAVYAAYETSEAVEKAADRQLLAQQVQINELRREVSAGQRQRQAELASAQDSFVQQLAEKDRTYAEAIEVFRDGVTDIAATSEGLEALAKFNGGDQAGAIAILDKLRAAHDQARQLRNKVESAAEGRRIALLAYDGWERGALRIDAVIPRFEEVNRLDPAVSWSWSILASLYLESGRLTDAEAAVQAATSAAQTLADRGSASRLQASISSREGDPAGVLKATTGRLAVMRELAAQNPANTDAQLDLSAALAMDAGALRATRNYSEARTEDDAAFRIVSQIGFTAGLGPHWQGEYQTQLASRSATYSSTGDFGDAEALLQAAIAIAARQSDAQSTNPKARAWVGTLLNELANVKLSHGNLSGAEADFEQSITENVSTATQDPLSQGAQRAMSYDVFSLGTIELSEGKYAEAQNHLLSVLPKFKAFAAVDNKDYVDRETVALADFALSIIPGSGVGLSDVIAAYDDVAAVHPLSAAETGIRRRLRKLQTEGAGDRPELWPAVAQQLGDITLASGDTPGAAVYYQLARAHARRLASAGDGSAELRNVIAICDQRLEEIHRRGEAAALELSAQPSDSAAEEPTSPSGSRRALGVLTVDVSPEFAAAAEMSGLTGVVVVDVKDGSNAQSAGVKIGDVLTAINGEKISGGENLRRSVAVSGSTLALQLLRNGRSVDIAVSF